MWTSEDAAVVRVEVQSLMRVDQRLLAAVALKLENGTTSSKPRSDRMREHVVLLYIALNFSHNSHIFKVFPRINISLTTIKMKRTFQIKHVLYIISSILLGKIKIRLYTHYYYFNNNYLQKHRKVEIKNFEKIS